jgi:hypothetical protein
VKALNNDWLLSPPQSLPGSLAPPFVVYNNVRVGHLLAWLVPDLSPGARLLSLVPPVREEGSGQTSSHSVDIGSGSPQPVLG